MLNTGDLYAVKVTFVGKVYEISYRYGSDGGVESKTYCAVILNGHFYVMKTVAISIYAYVGFEGLCCYFAAGGK